MKIGGSRAVTNSLNILTATKRRSLSTWLKVAESCWANESTRSKTSWRETRVPSTSSRRTWIKQSLLHKTISIRHVCPIYFRFIYPVENPLPNLRSRYLSCGRVFHSSTECECSRFCIRKPVLLAYLVTSCLTNSKVEHKRNIRLNQASMKSVATEILCSRADRLTWPTGTLSKSAALFLNDGSLAFNWLSAGQLSFHSWD